MTNGTNNMLHKINRLSNLPNKSPCLKFALILVAVLMLALMSCVRRPPPEYEPNDVDLSPIIDLDIPIETTNVEKIIDVGQLKLLNEVTFPGHTETLKTNDLDFLYKSDVSRGSSVAVSFEIFLHKDVRSAYSWVKESCDDSFNGAPIASSGQGEINGTPYFYCIYDLKLQRGDPSSFWSSTGIYSGFIFIQKGNMDIVISEYTETIQRQTLNESIREVAKTFYEAN